MQLLAENRMKISLLLFVCALVAEEIYTVAGQTCATAPDCALFPNQNNGMVSLQQLTQKIQSKHWIMIYYSEFSSKQTYGKCNFRWNAPDSDQNVKRELMCYNNDMSDCEDYVQKVKRSTDDCSRASENNVTSKLMNAKFYSQNLDQYFWYDSCYEYNAANECTTRYLDLLVAKTRYPDSDKSQLDLFELPWKQIISDLKNHFNMDISDPRMKFSWTGPECGFDGKVIKDKETNNASQGGLDFLAYIVIFVVTCML